jgi:hypothetical protein
VKGVILVMAVVAFGLSAGSAEPLFTPMFGDEVVEIPQFGRLPTQPSWGFCRGRERIQPGISPLGLSSPKGTVPGGGFSVSGTPNVSQHPMRGLRAGQDGISEPGDEGAVLALNLAANSHNLGDRILIDELAAEGVAGHTGAGRGHAHWSL